MRNKSTDKSKDASSAKNAPPINSLANSPTNVLALPPRPLTLKEKNVLEFLEQYIGEKGISPSYQEICENFGFASYNSVQRYLKQLEQKGYIQIPGGNQKRAITILRAATSVQAALGEMQKEVTPVASAPQTENFSIPLLGRVAAGAPIEAMEHDEFIDVPASLVRNADRTYALRVQGQSMIDDGILDGDVILVQKQAHATNGEIVVAMVGDEATVKRYYMHASERIPANVVRERFAEYGGATPMKNAKMVELRPANSTMSSMWFGPNEVQLRGIVVGLIRKFW